MKLTKEQLAMLETPCVILDVAQARRNIEAMQAAADAAGCALRPHIKTHKMAATNSSRYETGDRKRLNVPQFQYDRLDWQDVLRIGWQMLMIVMQ